jgi:hypothetical protein
MPKTKKKTRKLNGKLLLALVLGLLLVIGVLAQIIFNIFVTQQLQQLSAFHTSSLIRDAIQGIEEQKTKLSNNNRIPEARLQLPAKPESITSVVYYYEEASDNWPESFQVTTNDLVALGLSKLNGQSHEEIFENVPEAQACSRGFTLRFNQPEGEKAHTSKKLVDGRTLYVWREHQCGQGGRNHNEPGTSDADMRFQAMDELESYLLRAQSY